VPVFHHEGVGFYYEQHGQGTPLVITHGLTGDLNQITELLGELPGYSLLVWDARGHGHTEPLGPLEAFTFERFAMDLAELLDYLKIDEAVLGGVSMGAGVSIRLALDRPHLARALILIRPAWLDRPSPEPLRVATLVGTLAADWGADEGRRRFQKTNDYQELQRRVPATAEGFLKQFDKPYAAERSVRLRSMPQSCPIRNWEEAATCQVPTLIIGTEADDVHPYAFAEEWARRLPNSTLATAPSKLSDEAGYQCTVRGEVRRFLDRL